MSSEFIDSFHKLTVPVLSQLATFLILYRANDEKSLFASHHTTMLVAVSTILFYYFLHRMLLQSLKGRFAAVVQLLLVCSGYATVSTLAAPLLPPWAAATLYLISLLLCTPFCTVKYFCSVGTDNNITAFYKGTALIIPVLTTLLQLKYQLGTGHDHDQNISPFATHQRTMLVAASSSAAFYLSYIAVLRSTTRPLAAAAAHVCLACSGYASVASLTSLLFPDSVTPYVYSIFLLISAAELVYYYRRMRDDEDVGFQACRRSINRFLNDMCRIASNSFGQRPHILPF